MRSSVLIIYQCLAKNTDTYTHIYIYTYIYTNGNYLGYIFLFFDQHFDLIFNLISYIYNAGFSV